MRLSVLDWRRARQARQPPARRRGEPGHAPAAHHGKAPAAPAGGIGEKLAWDAFAARYFPERRRHDLEAVAAYGAYKRGRDWRSGLYLDMGGPDLEDVLGGVDYLKSLGNIDMSRIGIWGVQCSSRRGRPT